MLAWSVKPQLQLGTQLPSSILNVSSHRLSPPAKFFILKFVRALDGLSS